MIMNCIYGSKKILILSVIFYLSLKIHFLSTIEVRFFLLDGSFPRWLELFISAPLSLVQKSLVNTKKNRNHNKFDFVYTIVHLVTIQKSAYNGGKSVNFQRQILK